MKLAEQVNEPALMGKTLAEAELMPLDFDLFLETNLGAAAVWRRQMTRSLVAINAYKHGELWIESCLSANLSRWRSDQYGEFLLCLPFNSFLLDRLDAAAEEVQHYFWSHTQANFLELTQAERVLTQLLKFERPHFAINLLTWALQQTPGLVSPERIAEVLERAIRTPPSPDFDASSFAYHSAELLNYLEKTGLERDRLAELEWLYLRVHQHSRRPHILYGELSKNPALFIEALQCIFPAQNESTAEVSDNAKAFALLALDFLESWKQMPGVQDDGSVDAEALRT
jgi:hypothetical protein